MDLKIAAAIMDADLAHLGEVVAQMQEAGADLLHVDIMDGHYVPAFVGCTRVLRAVKRLARVPVDVHLMVSNPHRAVPWFLEAGADIILFHPDAAEDPAALIRQIHKAGRLAGVALKPDMPAELVQPLAGELDCVMAMTVFPGFSGQQFIEQGCAKIPELRRLCRPNVDIYVDGGINLETAPTAIRYGANVLATASAIFDAGVPPGEALKSLRQVALEAWQGLRPVRKGGGG